MNVIDLHAHYIPEECLTLERTAGGHTFGFRAEVVDGIPHVTLDGRLVLGPDIPGQAWMRGDGIAKLWDVDVRLADMAASGVTTQVLAVPPFMYFYGIDAAEALACSRALNEGIARTVSEHPESFLGLCTVPLQDPAAAVAELRRCVTDLGLAGVEINSNVNGRNLDDPELFPFFEAVAELDVPLFMHPHTPSAGYGLATDRFDRYYLRNMVGNPFETTLGVASMVFGRVFERLPGLRMYLAHCGGNIPFNRGRWQHCWADIPACQTIDTPPEQTIGSLYYDTIAHWEPALRFVADTIGTSQIVVGTDYPFDMGDNDPVATVISAFPDDADRQAIFWDNALRIFPRHLNDTGGKR
jgi:aminocarboxymuconate-semialdehyde decarboxylase